MCHYADVLQQQGQLNDAVAKIQEALKINPNDETSLSIYVSILRKQKKNKEADVIQAKIVQLSPKK